MPVSAAPPGTPFAVQTQYKPDPGDDTAIRYERHEPEKTLLHRVVREELEPFVARSRSAGAPVARFVEREIRACLECGVLAHSFLRVHRLKTSWRDGTTHVVMERRELLERLAPLIPPPRAHQVRYHGVLAPCASGRDRVVPGQGRRKNPEAARHRKEEAHSFAEANAPRRSDADEIRSDQGSATLSAAAPIEWPSGLIAPAQVAEARAPLRACVDPMDSAPRRTAWADLLQRVFEVDALCCPSCGGRMRVLSAITDPDVARRILECLRLPARAPPRSLADEPELALDIGLGFENANPAIDQADPGFEFDHSLPENDSA